jgi:uncharacterized protein YbjT (DUF2867 family)
MPAPSSVVMLGATGAVGNHTALTLAQARSLERLTLLGRRQVDNIAGKAIAQHTIDIFSPAAYAPLLAGHDAAICTLGVGQPSKMSRAEFVKIDHDAVLNFASGCRRAGVQRFALLSSVGADSRSASFYLRTKGQLEDALKALQFDGLSLFHPSMIITPTNRYGLTQAITLSVMPVIDPLLVGTLNRYRSVPVARLGAAIALDLFERKRGVQVLQWPEIMALSEPAAMRAQLG